MCVASTIITKLVLVINPRIFIIITSINLNDGFWYIVDDPSAFLGYLDQYELYYTGNF